MRTSHATMIKVFFQSQCWVSLKSCRRVGDPEWSVNLSWDASQQAIMGNVHAHVHAAGTRIGSRFPSEILSWL